MEWLKEIVVKFLLPKGIAWLEDYSEDKKEEVLSWVREHVPGDKFDALAAELTEDVLKHAFLIAKEYLADLEKDLAVK